MTLLRSMKFRCLLVLMTLLAGNLANAQMDKYLAGVHYQLVPPAPALQDLQRSADKPAVTEVFWYGCPHCYAFDPLLDAWVTKQGDAINFSRIPLSGSAAYNQHARIFYTAQALGLGEKMHKAIFDSIHQRHNMLSDEASVQKLFADYGVTTEKLAETWKSFSVETALHRNDTVIVALKIPSVPAMVVNGKYLVSVESAVPSHEAMLEVVEFLLHKK